MTIDSTDRAAAAAEDAGRAWLGRFDPEDFTARAELNAFIDGAAWGQKRERDRMAGLLAAVQARRSLDIESEKRFATHGVDPIELAAYLATARDVNDRIDAALAEGVGRDV